MFPLHDNSRRRICLAAFLGLCVIPTVIVLAFGLARHLPRHVQAEAKRLAWQLGQSVSLRRVRHLRPGVVLYEGLELSDPETRNPVLRCRTLKAGWKTSTDQQGRTRTSLLLIASQPEIQAAELDQVWRLVEKILTRRGGCPESDVELAAGRMTLLQGETAHTLTEVQGTIQRLSGGSQADFAFRLVGVETPEPIQIRVVRNHQTEPPATGAGLYTGGGALPCPLLALGLPELEALGVHCRFRGHFWANQAPEGWGGELVGEFSDVDLEGLVAQYFSHTLRGTAQLTIHSARFHNGRLQEATGLLVAGPGAISRSLLDAAADRLGMARRLERNVPNGPISYEQLALSFRIDSEGLHLRGECPPTGSAAILVSRFGIMLGEPIRQPVPVAALVETLVPPGELQVPATRPTGWLIRRLPIPQVSPTRTADASLPVAHQPAGEQ